MIDPEDQISLLALLAKADQAVAEEEYNMILFISRQLKIDTDRAKELLENPLVIPNFGDIAVQDKIEFLFNVVKLMKVDGKVHSKEIKFCEKLATKLGYKPNVIRDFSQFIYGDPELGTDNQLLGDIAARNLIASNDKKG